MSSLSFEAIGTAWVIDTDEPIHAPVVSHIHTLIEHFDRIFSRFRPDSLITHISQKAGKYEVPQEWEKIIALYKKMYDATAGLFTPLIGQLISDAGYDADYSLTQKTLTSPPGWEETLQYSKQILTTTRPALLDFGAAGKGYLVDTIGKLLQKNGIVNFCIDGGGDILYKNKLNKKLAVGLENPRDTTQAIGIVELLNQSIAASAGNRRAWKNFNHIINPKTLNSPVHILATWAIAPEAITADALATALFFTEVTVLAKSWDFEYLLLYPDFSVERSKKFPGEVFRK